MKKLVLSTSCNRHYDYSYVIISSINSGLYSLNWLCSYKRTEVTKTITLLIRHYEFRL